MKIDFSQFHPIDHRAFSKRCRRHYGGGWRHLKIDWDTRLQFKIRKPLYRILCKLGKHFKMQTWDHKHGFRITCYFCHWSRPAEKHEEFENPDFSGAEIVGVDEYNHRLHGEFDV